MAANDTVAEQRFEEGYSVTSWELVRRPLIEALTCIAEAGFPSFTTMVSDGWMWDYSRQYMRTGTRGAPRNLRDWEMLQRIGRIARAGREVGVRPISLSWHGEFVNPMTWETERDIMSAVLHVLRGVGAHDLILSGGPPPSPDTHNPDGYRLFASRLAEIGAIGGELGIGVGYHPHHDCFVEGREQLDPLMDVLDTDAVGLCIDTAHLYANGTDPLGVVRDYIDHAVHIQFKDARTGGEPLAGPARYRAFCELGTGDIEFGPIRDLMLERGFDGAVTLELDRPEGKTAEQTCHDNAAWARDTLGLELGARVVQPAAG